MARALINVPAKAKRGEVIEIKTLISHNMETGFRPDNTGKPVPRDIITEFVCKYNGEEIFRAELFPAICRQSVPDLFHHCHRERHAEFRMDRRQRLFRDRVRQYHRRMRSGAVAAVATAVLAATAIAAEIPLADRKSGYDVHGA